VKQTPAAIRPFRFRIRLAVAFLAVASAAASVVAVGAYFLVRNDRINSFHGRSRLTAGLAVSIIEDTLRSQEDGDSRDLVRRFKADGAFEALVVVDGQEATTEPGFDLSAIPPRLETRPVDDGYLEVDAQIGGRHGVILHPPESVGEADVYMFFSQERLREQMRNLAFSLWRAWIIVAVLAGVLGLVLARQTLRPVARASAAARSLAEGLLETRLPIDREDEFGAWAMSFNEMADELQKKIEAITAARDRERRFTSDVAHELRTPLTALVGSAELLRAHLDELGADARFAAHHLLAEVIRLRKLVDELLEISRLDAGRETPSMIEIRSDLFLHSLMDRRGWRDDIELDTEPITFRTDPRRLERIVSNLIDNALLHGRPPARVATLAENGQVRIVVSDQGNGIAPEHLPKVFDRFFKADPSRAGGTGLGLAIALENAVLLGGDIKVGSRPGGPTAFTVILPRG
jgi:two-component system sensor histidine kinase MtrB